MGDIGMKTIPGAGLDKASGSPVTVRSIDIGFWEYGERVARALWCRVHGFGRSRYKVDG